MSVDGVFRAGRVAAVGAARDVAAVNGARDGEGIGVSDRVGAKRLYAIGLAAFLASSAACGLAPTLGFLIASRAVQGSAAAVMLPASLALAALTFGVIEGGETGFGRPAVLGCLLIATIVLFAATAAAFTLPQYSSSGVARK